MSYTAPLKDMLFDIEHLAEHRRRSRRCRASKTPASKPRRPCSRNAPTSTRT